MKFLYKYPQAAYPYADLVETNRRRSRNDMEYELLDTGIFDQDRYFDVFVEYAKASPEDILVKITACNRGGEAAELHLLPTLWFRNDWATWIARRAEKPMLRQIDGSAVTRTIAATACRARSPTISTAKVMCRCSLRRTKPTMPSSSSTSRTWARTSRMASTTMSSRGGRMR